MVLAVASGKGGTGKTTFAVALACSAEEPVILLDCDVEEPNCHLYLNTTSYSSEDVIVNIPEIDSSRCVSCGLCSDFCSFNAISPISGNPLVFRELCHGCGGCAKICPYGAISEVPMKTGAVYLSVSQGIELVHGELDISKAMSPPVIKAVKKHIRNGMLNIVDCPPGTSCPMIAAVKGADYVLLVTEPTPFGYHDLMLAVETIKELSMPFGVAINRSDSGDNRIEEWCREHSVPILLRMPEKMEIAEACSKGEILVEAFPELRRKFVKLFEDINSAYERNRNS